MEMNSLYSLAQSIKNTESIADSKDFADVSRYCVEKHNETRKILADICKFLEDNFTLFENGKGGWKFRNEQYHTNYDIGSNNPFNCVIRDLHHEACYSKPHHDSRMYWVDGGICFWWLNGKVVHVSSLKKPYQPHGYGKSAKWWNSAIDYQKFLRFGFKYSDTTQDMFLGEDWNSCLIRNEFEAKKVKNDVDNDYALAVDTFEKLGKTILAIKKSVEMRLCGIDEMKDSSSNTTKTTLVIQF